MKTPNPLDKIKGERILSDKGIRQALDLSLIKTTPSFDKTDLTRIQPATLDVKVKSIETGEPIDNASFYSTQDSLSLAERHISEVQLTELIDFGQFNGSNKFINVSTEARSSVRRLGGYIPSGGAYFFSNQKNTELEIGNFSQNSINFQSEDRIAQVFFRVDPFADKLEMTGVSKEEEEHYYELFKGEDKKSFQEKGEIIRSLDMGIEVNNHKTLKNLSSLEYFEVKPRLRLVQGTIAVTASNVAYRMKKIDGGVNFWERDKYSEEELFEPIDISNGYAIKPFEHVVIETNEKFILSPHVGIRFWDNIWQYKYSKNKENHMKNPIGGIPFLFLTDGWVDPGYKGGFSRQPKWLEERVVNPGDIIGFGQVFFFPNGVGKSYGSSSLESQYSGKKDFSIKK